VLLHQAHLALAMLRFAPHATIDEHPAEHVVDVICLEGNGFTSIDGESATLVGGQRVTWPANHPHRLWTEDQRMLTLMVEHLSRDTD
jgi:quercetin dioxygenase-like cupin family protein